MGRIPLHLAAKVARTLKTSRVINIVGCRQTGHTTLVRDILPVGRFLNLNDEGLLSSLALSTITLFDGATVTDFDGLPASASHWL